MIGCVLMAQLGPGRPASRELKMLPVRSRLQTSAPCAFQVPGAHGSETAFFPQEFCVLNTSFMTLNNPSCSNMFPNGIRVPHQPDTAGCDDVRASSFSNVLVSPAMHLQATGVEAVPMIKITAFGASLGFCDH